MTHRAGDAAWRSGPRRWSWYHLHTPPGTDVEEIAQSEGVDGLVALPTIGKGIASAIWEMVHTGRWSQLERLRGSLQPETLLRTVPGIGPAMAERIIELNDKARGEVVVEVQIMEVNKTNLRQWGIDLSNYGAGMTLAPTGAEGEVTDGFTNIRAHVLSSLNRADWVVSLPSTIFQ